MKEQVKKRLQNVLEANKSDAPENFQAEWRRAASVFMSDVISKYSLTWGVMGTTEIDNAFAALENGAVEAKSEKKGPGNFPQWFEQNRPAEFKLWNDEKAARAQKEAQDKADKAQKEAEEKARQDEAAKTKAETEAKEKADADKLKAEADEAALDAEEEPSATDQIRKYAEEAGEGSMKKGLLWVASAFATFSAFLAKLPWIGNKIRGSWISNEELAKEGDELAIHAIEVGKTLRKFGISKKYANGWAEAKTKDVVKELATEVPKMESNDAEKPKMQKFLESLLAKGGKTSDATIFEFTKVEDIKPKESTTAPAPTAAPATPSAKADGASSESAKQTSSTNSPTANAPATGAAQPEKTDKPAT
jgi:hypothetical protein